MLLFTHDMVAWLQQHQFSCPVKKYLHLDCPGCGMQRSFLALLQGDIRKSIHYHPATLLLLLLFMYAMLHLRFQFKQGNRVVVMAYGLIATIVLVNFMYKTLHHIIV